MQELRFKPGHVYEFINSNEVPVFTQLRYVETTFNPASKEICLHFEVSEDGCESPHDIYFSQSKIDQQISGIVEASEYQVRYEY